MFLLDTYPSTELSKKEQEIYEHPAWHDLLIGVDCENLLRKEDSFSYLLRAGEARFHYYLSFVVESPFMFKHQPFTLALKDDELGWGYQNAHSWWATQIEEFIPLIIHQPAHKCVPILKHRRDGFEQRYNDGPRSL